MNKKLKRAVNTVVAIAMVLGLASCGTEAEPKTTTAVSVEEPAENTVVSFDLKKDAVVNLLSEYGIENETYAEYVVAKVEWTEVADNETVDAPTDTDFVKYVEKDGKYSIYHATVSGNVLLGEIHTTKANKSNSFYKLGLKGCVTSSTPDGKISYDFTYDLSTVDVDLAAMEAALSEKTE